MKSKLQINLLGTSFTLTSDQDSEKLNDIVNAYTELLNKVQTQLKIADSLKVAIIAGILASEKLIEQSEVTSDLSLNKIEENEKLSAQNSEIEKKTIELIKKLDECIKNK